MLIPFAVFVIVSVFVGVNQIRDSNLFKQTNVTSFDAAGVTTTTAPASTCDAHAGTLANIPTDACNLGVASLVLDSAACASAVGGVTGCTGQSGWSVVQDDVEQASALIDEGTCGSQIQYPIMVKKTADGYTYIGGSAALRIANAGSCDAALSSVLFILEQSVGSYTGPGPVTYSYGPSGLNFYSWAVAGVENTAITAQCDSTEAPFPMASTCDLNSPSPCRVNIPYADHSLYTPAGAVLSIANAVVPKAPVNNTDGCSVSLPLNVSYVFKVKSSVYAQLAASPSNFRVSALVSFDACCPRGAACGIDLTCDGSGKKSVVRTVQIRSPAFSIPVSCASRCDCVDVVATPANSVTSTDGFCSGSVTTGSGSFAGQVITTVCDSANLTFPVTPCCGPNACPCSGTASSDYAVQHSNLVSLVAHSNDCVDLVSDTALVASDAALGTFHCKYPPASSCVMSAWSVWGTVDTDCTTKCFTNTTYRRTVVSAPCHTSEGCGATEQSVVTVCPTICTLSAWTAWSACACPTDATTGTQTRTRSVLQDQCNAPGACSAQSPQTQSCSSCPLPPPPPAPTPSPIVVVPSPSSPVVTPPPPPPACVAPQSCKNQVAVACDIFGKCNGTTISCTTSADCAAIGRCNVTNAACRTDVNCPCASNLCTYTKGGYAVCLDKSQNPPQCAKMNQTRFYPLSIGYPGKFLPYDSASGAGKRSLTWTSWQTLATVINGGSTPALLPANKNPVDSAVAIDVFQAQLATATLNRLILPYELYFRGTACASASVPAYLKTLFSGMPMTQILAFIDAYDASVTACLSTLSTTPGCASILSNSNNSPSNMTAFLDFFNRAFDNCIPSADAQGCFASTPS